MAHTDPMTWRAASKRWSKNVDGKSVNVSCKKLVDMKLMPADAPHTKEGSRLAMRMWWAAKQVAEERNAPLAKAVAEAEEVLATVNADVAGMHKALASPPPEKTIGACADKWLASKRGRIDPMYWETLRCELAVFRDWAGDGVDIDSITGARLEDARDHLQEMVDDKKVKCSATYAGNILGTVKEFLRWAYETERLDRLPRNIGSRQIVIKGMGASEVQTADPETLEKLLAAADGRQKLYLLLMLNCGFTQSDIAQLLQDEVDWERGVITRQRTKTKGHPNVPTVSYILWDETWELFQAHRSDHATLVLLNEDGGPLLKKEIRDGKGKKVCNVSVALYRYKKAIGVKMPLKLLRKTGATKLAEHDAYGKYAQHYLGHSPRTVADKHYVRPSSSQFEKAIRWLGEQFGYTTGKR